MRLTLISLLLSLPLLAGDLDFKEQFADPTTREASLSHLIPGTRDWFFYRALNQQLQADWPAFSQTMIDWQAASKTRIRPVATEGYTSLYNRELLLRYEADPERNLTALIKQLELKFDDTRPDAREVENLSDTLDPTLISEASFAKEAARGSNSPWKALSTPQLLASLDQVEKFTEPQLRHYLKRLRRADHPGIVALVNRGLKLKSPISFGKSPLHRRLTLAQLDELLEIHPELISSEQFALLYLSKLRTHSEDAFARDPSLHAAFIEQCREFSAKLPPALVSLRAHVLFHHLRLQRELGEFPLKDFIAYLSIPRNEHPILRGRPRNERASHLPQPSLSKNYDRVTGCPPVDDDQQLIDSLLLHFLAKADSAKRFAPFVEESTLAPIHARAPPPRRRRTQPLGKSAGPQPFRHPPRRDPSRLCSRPAGPS